MSFEVTIGGRKIGAAHRPYIIAEMSGNHNGDLDRALQIIEEAHKAGADAVKLQTYTADTITLDQGGLGFEIEEGLWAGRRLYELYEEAFTPWEWHEALFAKGKELGIDVFSSPFDATAVDFLEQFDPPAYKIASFELLDIPLIEKCAATGKPLIMSTGMANLSEVQDAVKAARGAGCKDLVVLHCVSGYPAPIEDVNLTTLPHLQALTGTVVGLSDHTMGTEVAIGAVAVGARVIEKHVTIRRADGGPDSAFSLEPEELKQLVDHSATVHKALGRPTLGMVASEVSVSQMHRRSLYVVEDLKAGDIITEKNVLSKRPGFGLRPKYLKQLLGQPVTQDIKAGTALSKDHVEQLRIDEHATSYIHQPIKD